MRFCKGLLSSTCKPRLTANCLCSAVYTICPPGSRPLDSVYGDGKGGDATAAATCMRVPRTNGTMIIAEVLVFGTLLGPVNNWRHGALPPLRLDACEAKAGRVLNLVFSFAARDIDDAAAKAEAALRRFV